MKGFMAAFEPVLLRNRDVENSTQLKVYESNGGYEGARKALKMSSGEVIEEVKNANLRGRGGAGFPAGVKWGFLPKDRMRTLLCVNADESEPPTFSNRVLMETDPHQLIEGTIIAAYATRAQIAYLYLRVEFHEQFHIMQKAIDEARTAWVQERVRRLETARRENRMRAEAYKSGWKEEDRL